MFKRKIYDKLLAWKQESEGNTALLIEGPRRVGKSTVVTELQLQYGTDLHERNSLIIFDEVQLCPPARQAIKSLVRDHRYDYIETGSLISLKRNVKNILIPSEERKLGMYPMDYEEFLWATGDTSTAGLLRKALEGKRPLGEQINRKLMRDFRLYMLVGGMPQAVAAYIETI